MSRFTRIAVSFGFLVLLLLVWTPTHAVTFTVNSNADSGAGTLREAIDMANSNANGPGVVDEIEFDLTLPDTISLTTGELTISDDLTINGPGADMLTVSGSNLSRIFSHTGGDNVTISGLKITDGNGVGFLSGGNLGGAILLASLNSTVELNDCVLENNSTSGGTSLGAITNGAQFVKLVVNRCSFTNNSAVSTTGGLAGGGVFSAAGSEYTLEVNDSTFTSNYAQSDGVVFGGVINLGAALLDFTFTNCTFDSNYIIGNGKFVFGGVLGDGAAGNSVKFINSTFFGNYAECNSDGCQSYGGAIGSGGNSDISCDHCTFHSNSVSCTGVGCTTFGESIAPPGSDGSMTLSNTIIQADNVSNNCNGFVPPIISLGYNIDNGSSCVDGTVMGDKANTDPMVDPLGLQDNGGLTETIALQELSPAIDMADPASVLTEDQRKAPRPFSMQNDIGAFEFGALPPGVFFHNPISPALAGNPNMLTAEEASPEGPVAFVWGFTEGSVIVGGATCNGTELGINNPRVLGIVDSSTEGIAELIFFIPLIGDLEFSVFTQAVDINTCDTSEVIEDVIRKE